MPSRYIPKAEEGDIILPPFNEVVAGINSLKERQISFVKDYDRKILGYRMGKIATRKQLQRAGLGFKADFMDNRYFVIFTRAEKFNLAETPPGSTEVKMGLTEVYIEAYDEDKKEIKVEHEYVVAENIAEIILTHTLAEGEMVIVFWIETDMGIMPFIDKPSNYRAFQAIITGSTACENREGAWLYTWRKFDFHLARDPGEDPNGPSPHFSNPDSLMMSDENLGRVRGVSNYLDEYPELSSTYKAINSYEMRNDGSDGDSTYGIGTTVDNIEDGTSMTLQPVEDHTIVTMHADIMSVGNINKAIFYFSEPNGIDGTC